MNLRGHDSCRILLPLLKDSYFPKRLLKSLTTEPGPSSELLLLVMAVGEEGIWPNLFERGDPLSMLYKNWVVSFLL